MRNRMQCLRRLLFVGLCALGLSSYVAAEVNPKPFVLPELKTWTGAEGTFAPSGRVVYSGGKEVKAVAELFAQNYQQLTGKNLTVVSGKAKTGDFELKLRKNAKEGKEGYTLNIGNVATASANHIQGLKWATRTLLQLSERRGDKNYSLMKGSTTDIPEYALRGFTFDVGRKYVPMSYLHSLIKMMAYYKMNTLQLHLNDNGFRQYFGNDWNKTQAAFRLESTTYPGLTAKDGSYTKAEFVEFQKLAESYGVEVIPEIDVPAHSLAFTQYKPEIGSKEYGMDHLDLFNPATYEFLDGLFKEYLGGKDPVFRGPRVHIGTDEYSNAKKDVVEKFRYFTDRYIKYVESFGKQAMVWGALTHAKGETPVKAENVWMDCWYNGYANPVEMKKQGYQLVSIPDGLVYIVPAAGYYYDYLNCQHLYNNWTPATIGNVKFEENDPAILGGMFAVWNDHAGNGISVADIHDRLYPALQTIAMKTWTGKHVTLSYADFDKLRHQLSEAPGVNEAGRLRGGKYQQATVPAGSTLSIEKAGYGSTVSFTIDCKAEAKGTELFRSSDAVFYLSDPKSGKLGFARDGYLNTFNYRLPAEGSVKIAVKCDNRKTTLFVNDKQQEVLDPLTVYAMKESDRMLNQIEGEITATPVVYNPGTKMHYQRTLVFPLKKAGNFKSKVTNLVVTSEK